SGGLFATRSEPMFWLPPVRFSTTTGWLQTPDSPWAMARAIVSGEPPGVSGTMILTGRSGKPCAAANAEKSAAREASSHLFMLSPPCSISRRQFTYSAPGHTMVFHRRRHRHADPRGTGEAVRRRVAVPVADPGAVRIERRVHAPAADRTAEGVRGAHQGKRRRAREEARHHAPQVLPDRWRHGRRVRGDER